MAEETTAAATISAPVYPDEGFREMVEAGVFFGRKQRRTHPRMKPYILTNRNGIEIINLAKTEEFQNEAAVRIKETVQNGGMVLFVATQPAAAERAGEIAAEFGYPFASRRWLGGTLTNFKVISKRIEHYKKLKEDWAMKRFEHYTKKERVVIEREIEKLGELLSGLEPLTDLPAMMFMLDPALHMTALREARKLGIPVVALINTDSDPAMVDYPVPGNTKSRSSINWFLEKVRTAIAEGKAARSLAAAEQAAGQSGAVPVA